MRNWAQGQVFAVTILVALSACSHKKVKTAEGERLVPVPTAAWQPTPEPEYAPSRTEAVKKKGKSKKRLAKKAVGKRTRRTEVAVAGSVGMNQAPPSDLAVIDGGRPENLFNETLNGHIPAPELTSVGEPSHTLRNFVFSVAGLILFVGAALALRQRRRTSRRLIYT